MTDHTQQFASDNYSGICPEVWAAMAEANRGHERAYGEDSWTARAADRFRHADSEGFVQLWGLSVKTWAAIQGVDPNA